MFVFGRVPVTGMLAGMNRPRVACAIEQQFLTFVTNLFLANLTLTGLWVRYKELIGHYHERSHRTHTNQ